VKGEAPWRAALDPGQRRELDDWEYPYDLGNSHFRNEKCKIKYLFFPFKYPYNSDDKWEEQSYVSIKIIKLKIVGAQ